MNTEQDYLTEIMQTLADINTAHFKTCGDIPAALLVAPSGTRPLDVLPLAAVSALELRDAVRDAMLTVTCLEGHIMEQHRSDPLPDDPENVASHPDARSCVVYFAQARDGTRACGVQYILRPEHGRASLAPLKVINSQSVAIVDNDLADLTRPGRRVTH